MSAIVLFDGDCHVCNWSIQFIMKRDPSGKFKFASLQGDIGRKLTKTYRSDPMIDSVLLVENDQMWSKSTAALRICRELEGPVRYLSLGLMIPRPLRDLVYDFIARNRFHWFGRKEQCDLPTKEERRRLLD
ncbi:DCC1-like thiol-disulfide oxidoreductase family protein [Jeotgalibacillus sp. ET6]|uniref:thiol-disulfide oxidoreductase DCC family protein n=1 Tax=Jeotgalibacillus sp. ET6 TaxID=3037260 RepID=UPI0024183DB8|nr:DCC1-like thiol-disulfide oxidoreductase family protein [Jeotgalibacillus sp. ET6]MDG5473431.1 DCC1-like thiol-disulfide oxidoreductase family protein [Jeotgalibacillus sp. ET6]